jgi:NDP-sugar pyrophosphorylase family protein
MNILIPIAGEGKRFLADSYLNPEYKKPKPLIKIAGHAMVEWALSSLSPKPEDKLIFLVLKKHVDEDKIDEGLREIYGDKIKIIVVDRITDGAACTALLAKDFINNEEPLIITDCDHYIDGDSLLRDIEKYKGKIDGMTCVFYSRDPKCSFSKADEDGFVIETAEKIPISRNAHIGAYYFAKGRDFVWAAEEMIEEDDRFGTEFYIAPVYNYLIRRGKKIRMSRMRFVHILGAPKDVDIFREFLRRGEVVTKFSYDLGEDKVIVESSEETPDYSSWEPSKE